jgi:hypothetical protein
MTRSRWLAWRPDTPILEKTASRGPSKPSKPLPGTTDKTIKTGFDGFDGPLLVKSPKIEAPRAAEPSDQEDLAAAAALLNRTGCRVMRLDQRDPSTIGIWSDLDSPAIRSALHILGVDELPIRYLDGPGVPLRYKLRHVAGEPLPESVRLEMERSPEPWRVREQMLGRGWRFVPWPTPAEKPPAIDPADGIRPVAEWGGACGRGFVSNARFGPNQPVIPRTHRKSTRARKPASPRKRRANA